MRLGTFQGCTLYSQSTNRTAKHGRHKQNRNLPPISLITKHLLLHIKREWESVAKGYFSPCKVLHFTVPKVTFYNTKGYLWNHNLTLQQIHALCHLRIGHRISLQTAFFCLNADICHRLFGGAFQIAVATCCNTDNGTFGNVEHLIIDLKLSLSGRMM